LVESTAGNNKVAILNKLIDVLDSISDFTDHVYGGYRPSKAIRSSKIILVHLVEDRQIAHATEEDVHELVFHILVKYRSNLSEDPKDQMDTFIDLVGKVEDALKEHYNEEGIWENLEIDRINYTFGAERDFVFYNGLLTVTIRAQW